MAVITSHCFAKNPPSGDFVYVIGSGNCRQKLAVNMGPAGMARSAINKAWGSPILRMERSMRRENDLRRLDIESSLTDMWVRMCMQKGEHGYY
jgi:hypothetical protein